MDNKEAHRETVGLLELSRQCLEEAGLPAGQYEGESVAVAAASQRVREQLPHLLQERAGVEVRVKVALRRRVGVPRGNVDCQRWHCGQVLVHWRERGRGERGESGREREGREGERGRGGEREGGEGRAGERGRGEGERGGERWRGERVYKYFTIDIQWNL